MPPTFAQLGAPDFIVRALAQRGISQPFAIQAATVADALAGLDVCGRAPTGSGKTLAFGIPLVAGVGTAQPHRPRALVLAPTRELASQIMTELRTFAGKRRVGVAYGGVGYGAQVKSLRRGVDILVACPGRLEDLISQGEADLSSVDKVVIDEADRMADMGFIPAVRRLLDQTSTRRQTMLFSATLDGDVATLTRDYQHDPVRHEVADETPDVRVADHVFWSVARTDRTDICAEAIDAAGSTVVFCRTRHGCDRVAKQLDRRGIRAVALHGGRSQPQRTRALAEFAAGKVQALVATDVAARGIHVEGVGAVVHYDLAADHKTYLHRSGRTARAGQGGVVVSLIQPEQARELKSMQRKMGLTQPITDVDVAAITDTSSHA
jgi:superfamily II DNA/RNA helicase